MNTYIRQIGIALYILTVFVSFTLVGVKLYELEHRVVKVEQTIAVKDDCPAIKPSYIKGVMFCEQLSSGATNSNWSYKDCIKNITEGDTKGVVQL